MPKDSEPHGSKHSPNLFRAVFWVVLPCKMIVDRRFRGTTQKTALNIILAAVRT
jgi:hypothetical protein